MLKLMVMQMISQVSINVFQNLILLNWYKQII